MHPTIELKIPAALKCAAEKAARKKGLTDQQFATATFVQIMEDYEDLRIAKEQSAAIANGKVELIPLEEIMDDYEMEY